MQLKPFLAVVCLVAIVAWSINYESKTADLGSTSADWKPVCVHGQLVYRANFHRKGMAVNALTEDGKPVKCKVGEFTRYNN